ncbi:MAG: hypothetical protein ACRBB6_10225 [Neptuniibacter sp.]
MSRVSLPCIILEKVRQEDKQQHFWYSFVIFCACCFFLNLPMALATTLLIGVVKEVWDHYYGSGFCWYDMLANCAGVFSAMIILYMLGV